MRRLDGAFDYSWRLDGMVAIRRHNSVQNCGVGSRISVAFQFLRFQNRNRLCHFRRSLGLFLPIAVLRLFVCPTN